MGGGRMGKWRTMLESAAVLAAVGVAFTGSALAGITYAAKNGSNSNACTSPATPCLTLGEALAQAEAAGGFNRVVIVGTGVFVESLTLTSATEIAGDASYYQAISPLSGKDAITINDDGKQYEFLIDNVQILGTFYGTGRGINVLDANSVNLQNVGIHGFGTAAIHFAPSKVIAVLSIENSIVGDGAGVQLQPTGNVNASSVISNTTIHNCFSSCLITDVSAMTGNGLNVLVKESTFANTNGYDIQATSIAGSTYMNVTVANTSATLSELGGVSASGPHTYVFLDHATIAHNAKGVTNTNGGTLLSFGDNDIYSNGIDINGSLSPISPR